MFRKFLFLAVLGGIIGLCSIVAMVASERSILIPASDVGAGKNGKDRVDDRVHVALVGDSWVAGGKLEPALANEFSSAGLDVVLESAGQPGAKSRQILANLLSSASNPYSSRRLVKGGADYLVITAGVNDSAGHIGADVYAKHVAGIAALAVAHGIYPVIIEIPDYGIGELPSAGALSQAKRYLYRVLFDEGEKNPIPHYRAALRQEQREPHRAPSWCGAIVCRHSNQRDIITETRRI